MYEDRMYTQKLIDQAREHYNLIGLIPLDLAVELMNSGISPTDLEALFEREGN